MFAFGGRARSTFGELCDALERAELEEASANAHAVAKTAEWLAIRHEGKPVRAFGALILAVEDALRAQARKREARAALVQFGKDGG